MKKILLFCIFLIGVLFSSAQNYTLRQNTISNLSIEFITPELQSSMMEVGDARYTSITMTGYDNSKKVGFPSLPELTKLIEIPLCDEVNVHIVSADYEEYDAATLNVLYPVMPCQPSYSKSYTGDRPFNKNEVVYRTDAFYTSQREVVTVHKIGTMRDVNLANVVVSPVAYNPVANKIRMYSRIEVEITYENADIPATMEMKDKYYSPLFHAAKEAVINPMNMRSEFNTTPIKYLIIANDMFANNEYLMSFVNWKSVSATLWKLLTRMSSAPRPRPSVTISKPSTPMPRLRIRHLPFSCSLATPTKYLFSRALITTRRTCTMRLGLLVIICQTATTDASLQRTSVNCFRRLRKL